MSNKAKYASHGAFIKKISQNFLPSWQKPKHAVINPIPSSQPRQRPINQEQKTMNVNSRTYNIKHKYQQEVKIKPVPQDLVQPFLYIEKVMKRKQKQKQQQGKKLKPFITSKSVKHKKQVQSNVKLPEGYASLFDYEFDKKISANRVFQRLMQSEIDNIKDIYSIWNKDPKRKLTQDINIKEDEFMEFMRELIPSKISNSHLKHFFELYKNPVVSEKQNTSDHKTISVKALSHNYLKYKKAQTEIINIMSEKAVKERYMFIKKYIHDFLREYPDLKIAMSGIKEYEQTLRSHFKRDYESYKNPFEDQIKELKTELQKPIIKYDKEKKTNLENKVEEYESENERIYSKLTEDYTNFMEEYETAIVKNHDLFFTKRTVAKLLQPIIQTNPYINRDLIQQRVGIKQQQKQRYLECLSQIVVEIDNDKKYIQEDCFTLGEVVEMITMRFKKMPVRNPQYESFTIQSMKKLIKQIKRQFLLMNNFSVGNIDSFPSDQQISLDILHLCFEMECTKVLFKNKIWTQLLQMIPERSVHSKYHQLSIDSNTCMEYLRKYFTKLDEKLKIQVNKSKEISLLAENAYRQNFGRYCEIIRKVSDGLDHYVQGADQDQSQIHEEPKKKKKVGFADVIDTKLAHDKGEQVTYKDEQEEQEIAKNLIKMIHTGNMSQSRFQEEPQHSQQPLNISMLKTLAKSYFQPQAINTNAFDIRFYEKMNEEEKKNNPIQEEIVKMGTSRLLQNAPNVDEISGKQSDPLRISRFLLKNIDDQVKETQKLVKHKEYEHDIGEGIGKSYYKQKLKLENKPTRFDCEGKSKYSVLLPVGYYESYIVGENAPQDEKWYLRPHHVETLTENPLSKKDNVIHTQYKSKLQKIPLKKRQQQFVIQQNVKRKQQLINSLEDRLSSLKRQLVGAKRQSDVEGAKVPPQIINEYYTKAMDGKEDKELQMAAYDGVLYDLRRKERQLLNNYRDSEKYRVGEPDQKWWQRKDKNFNHELKKDRKIVMDQIKGSGKHRQYISKLKNSQIY